MAFARISAPVLVASGLIAGGLVAAGALTASGALADATATPTPSGSTGKRPGGPGPGGPGGPGGHRPGPGGGFGGIGGFGGGPGGEVLHGEFVVKTADGTKTELVQRGSVTANGGGTVTVKSTDGFSVVWTVDAKTTIRAGRETEAVTALAVGDEVTAVGTPTSSGGTATMIGERPAVGSSAGPQGAPGAGRPGGLGRHFRGDASPAPSTSAPSTSAPSTSAPSTSAPATSSSSGSSTSSSGN